MFFKYCAILVCLCTFSALPTQAANNTERVLFVGNSFSFYSNGIHNHFANLLRADGHWQQGENRVRLLTLSGGHIHETGRLLQSHLEGGDDDWHTVILQGHSNEPIVAGKSDKFQQAMTGMITSLKQRNITPVLFMTWAYQEQPDMIVKLQQAYEQVARKHDVLVVPVGLAFADAMTRHPEINLYVKDVLGLTSSEGEDKLTYRREVKHPSVAGTYLAACVIFASLHHRSPEGNVFSADLDQQTAVALQRLSWQVVSNYNSLMTLSAEGAR